MKKVVLAAALLSLTFNPVQGRRGEILVFCNYYSESQKVVFGAREDPKAEEAVYTVLRYVGLRARNFEVRVTSEVDNAAAARGSDNRRYVLINPEFLQRLGDVSDFPAKSVLAHEIGHHLEDHTIELPVGDEWVGKRTSRDGSQTVKFRWVRNGCSNTFRVFETNPNIGYERERGTATMSVNGRQVSINFKDDLRWANKSRYCTYTAIVGGLGYGQVNSGTASYTCEQPDWIEPRKWSATIKYRRGCGGSRHAIELEADRFSGHVLYKMGASLDQAKYAMQWIADEKGSRTHPPKAQRLAQIEGGWKEARQQSRGL